MKNLLLIILVSGIFSVHALAKNENPQDLALGVSASFGDAGSFYAPLTPYGEWLELESGFYGWRPHRMHSGWRPYLNGNWSWTRFGWYWTSNEPFGWAVYHYGRWYYDDYYGWIWIPDNNWGPAWVEWRHNDDYIGWAPLPPYASFSFSIGIRFTTHWFAPLRYWSFVRYRHMMSPYAYREIVSMEYARRLIGTTRSAGRYEIDGDRVINRGVDRSIVERRGGYRRIESVDVQDSRTVGERFVRGRDQGRIEVYRPERTERERSSSRIEARKIDRNTSLDLQQVERPSRGATGETGNRSTERERGTMRSDPGSSQERARQPEIQIPRQESTQPRRSERRIEAPATPAPGRKEVERRREERFPFPTARERSEQSQERKSVAPERSTRQQQREVSAPRPRTEQSRPAPSTRQENSRGSEQSRRESGRKRG